MNVCVSGPLIRRIHSTFLQAADRRDRLIYVLSQINAARGEDALPIESESSEEESEDVRIISTTLTVY